MSACARRGAKHAYRQELPPGADVGQCIMMPELCVAVAPLQWLPSDQCWFWLPTDAVFLPGRADRAEGCPDQNWTGV